MVERAVTSILIADITGSTELYSRLGDVAAQQRVAGTVAQLRAIVAECDGHFVAQKGDDVLASFARPPDALAAARRMLKAGGDDALSIHAGITFGRVVLAEGDVFGETVNVASRLCGLASKDEICLSGAFVDQLGAGAAADLQPLGPFEIRGLAHPIEVFSIRKDSAEMNTEVSRTKIDSAVRRRDAVTASALVLEHRGRSLACPGGKTVVVGRSDACDLVLPHAWISRRHAVFSMHEGRATLADKSSLGTFVQVEGGREILIRRETLILPPKGIVSAAVSAASAEAEPIAFEIV
jgi:class 3 adenylate cyclase